MILIFLFCLIEKKIYKKSRNADIGRLKKNKTVTKLKTPHFCVFWGLRVLIRWPFENAEPSGTV